MAREHARIVMGLETEYSAPNGYRVDPRRIGIPGIRAEHENDTSGMGGLMLVNGGSFYVDCEHPEYCTPECENPWDLVRCARAGDRLVAQLMRRSNLGNASLSNVDYAAYDDHSRSSVHYHHDKVSPKTCGMTTWGSHESYSCRGHRLEEGLRGIMALHVASRSIICGAGGISYNGAFVISPRLFNGMFSPGEYKEDLRWHVMAGDSLCSDLALFLKFASTSLIYLTLVHEPGVRCSSLAMDQFGNALRVFSGDPTMRATVTLCGLKTPATSLGAQMILLDLVKPRLKAEWMPSWAPRAWRIWRDAVMRLRRGPMGLARSIDWAIKYALYEGMRGRQIEDVFATDTRFPILGDGLFKKVEKQLDCRVPGARDVGKVMRHAPRGTRAEARARVIAKLLKRRRRFAGLSYWDKIEDGERIWFLNLCAADPTTTGEDDDDNS